MSTDKFQKDSFGRIDRRLKKALNLKNSKQLIEIIGIPQPTYSGKKRKNNFDAEWVLMLSLKYNFEPQWILTGKGQKYSSNLVENLEKNGGLVDDPPENSRQKEVFLMEIEEWLMEMEKKEPGRRTWFKYDFLGKYPDFEKWLKRKDARGEGDPIKRVA